MTRTVVHPWFRKHRALVWAAAVLAAVVSCSDDHSPTGVSPTEEGYSFTGTCIDVYSGLPVAGLEVLLQGHDDHRLTTDANGRFSIGGFPQEDTLLTVTIASSFAGLTHHKLTREFALTYDIDHTFFMVPVEHDLQPVPGVYDNVFQLLIAAYNPKYGRGTKLRYWRKLPVDVYITDPGVEGTDFRAIAIDAIGEWNDSLSRVNGVHGIPAVFRVVDTDPHEGIHINLGGRGHGSNTHVRMSPEGYPERDSINIDWEIYANVPHVIRKVVLHEVGHSLPWRHLEEKEYLMVGGRAPPDHISSDEARAAVLMYSLPRETDLAIYDATPSPTGVETVISRRR